MDFRKEIETAINRHSMENGSNTPDFILAQYLADCLRAFDHAVLHREKWYGRAMKCECPENAGCSRPCDREYQNDVQAAAGGMTQTPVEG